MIVVWISLLHICFFHQEELSSNWKRCRGKSSSAWCASPMSEALMKSRRLNCSGSNHHCLHGTARRAQAWTAPNQHFPWWCAADSTGMVAVLDNNAISMAKDTELGSDGRGWRGCRRCGGSDGLMEGDGGTRLGNSGWGKAQAMWMRNFIWSRKKLWRDCGRQIRF